MGTGGRTTDVAGIVKSSVDGIVRLGMVARGFVGTGCARGPRNATTETVFQETGAAQRAVWRTGTTAGGRGRIGNVGGRATFARRDAAQEYGLQILGKDATTETETTETGAVGRVGSSVVGLAREETRALLTHAQHQDVETRCWGGARSATTGTRWMGTGARHRAASRGDTHVCTMRCRRIHADRMGTGAILFAGTAYEWGVRLD